MAIRWRGGGDWGSRSDNEGSMLGGDEEEDGLKVGSRRVGSAVMGVVDPVTVVQGLWEGRENVLEKEAGGNETPESCWVGQEGGDLWPCC